EEIETHSHLEQGEQQRSEEWTGPLHAKRAEERDQPDEQEKPADHDLDGQRGDDREEDRQHAYGGHGDSDPEELRFSLCNPADELLVYRLCPAGSGCVGHRFSPRNEMEWQRAKATMVSPRPNRKNSFKR